MTTKKIGNYRITLHGIDHAQYFPGHGIAFSKFEDCATGCGSTEVEALNDALESLAQNDWNVSAWEERADVKAELKDLSDETPEELEEAYAECGENGECNELYVYVSVDVSEDTRKPFDHYTSVGSYPLVYCLEAQGIYGKADSYACADCATEARYKGADVEARTILTITPHAHYEGAPFECDGCSEEIESAYGDPDEAKAGDV